MGRHHARTNTRSRKRRLPQCNYANTPIRATGAWGRPLVLRNSMGDAQHTWRPPGATAAARKQGRRHNTVCLARRPPANRWQRHMPPTNNYTHFAVWQSGIASACRAMACDAWASGAPLRTMAERRGECQHRPRLSACLSGQVQLACRTFGIEQTQCVERQPLNTLLHHTWGLHNGGWQWL